MAEENALEVAHFLFGEGLAHHSSLCAVQVFIEGAEYGGDVRPESSCEVGGNFVGAIILVYVCGAVRKENEILYRSECGLPFKAPIVLKTSLFGPWRITGPIHRKKTATVNSNERAFSWLTIFLVVAEGYQV